MPTFQINFKYLVPNNISLPKIIILIDEQIQSHLEDLTMALQTSPNIYTLGDTSAAALSYIKQVYLPGNILFTFTEVAAYYPNEKCDHRSFVKIDYPVKQIDVKCDLLIKEAIKKIIQPDVETNYRK